MSKHVYRWWRQATLVILLVAASGTAASQTEAPTPLPEPVESTPAASAAPDSAPGDPLAPANLAQLPADPFPSTGAMTDTVAAVAAALNQLPQPLTPPDGAVLEHIPAVPERGVAAAQAYLSYVPFVGRVRTPPPPAPRPLPPPADISVTVWPQPSIRVIRGGTLRYTVRVTNHGTGEAGEVYVRLPYPRQQLWWQYATFSPGSGDYVSRVAGDVVETRFEALAAGKSRSATLTYRTAATLANDTVVNFRAVYSWADERDGGTGAANWTPVLIGAGNADSPYLWMSRNPAVGRAGTEFQFFSDRFEPGEGVFVWLNTPWGVRPTELQTVADRDGRVWLNLGSAELAAGNYSLVAYGARSNLTAVAGFAVTR